jgi:hypothetical protein
LLIISILLPNVIAATREKLRLMQRQQEIARLGNASAAK